MFMKKYLIHLYFKIRTWLPVWRILNYKSRHLYRKGKPALDDVQTRIVQDLKRDGIAVTSLEELFPGENLLEKLQQYATSLEGSATSRTKKKFLKHYWELTPILDLKNPFTKLALQKRILDIANSYMKMWTKLQYYTLIKTIPAANEKASYSQKWHRDPQEKRICKMFIYLNDVDENTGPFIYVPKSVYGKKPYGHLFPQNPPLGSYPDEKEVYKSIPKKDIKTYTGKAGSVIFCDASGIHRGGHAKSKERLMSTFFYSAKTFKEEDRYKLPKNTQEIEEMLSKEALYAIKR